MYEFEELHLRRLISVYFKRTDLATPDDGQECLIFNECDGFRVAEWCASRECFMCRDVEVSAPLAALWMELPAMEEDLSNMINSVLVTQQC